MKQILTIFLALIAVLFVIGLLMNLGGIAPTPTQYAAATATVFAAQGQATRTAIDNAAASSISAAYVAARQTAVPGEVAVENQNAAARNAMLTLAVLAAVVVLALIGLGVAMITRRKALTISRDDSGQLPGYDAHGMYLNLQAVPAVTFPTKTAPAEILGGWSQEQSLAAFQSALQPTNLAALMRPGAGDVRERNDRVKITRQDARHSGYGQIAPAQVTIIGDGRVAEQLAERAGLQLPARASEPARTAMQSGYEILPPTPPAPLELPAIGEEE